MINIVDESSVKLILSTTPTIRQSVPNRRTGNEDAQMPNLLNWVTENGVLENRRVKLA